MMDLLQSRETVERVRQGLSFEGRAFIDGRLVDAASGETFDCLSSRDGAKLADVASCDEEDVNRAVAAARSAFEDGRWRLMPPRERKKVLTRFAQLFEAHIDELAVLETLDMGKTITEARAVDCRNALYTLEWYAEWCDKLYDEIAPTAHDMLATITREPTGVVGAVVAWNFPMVLSMWKIAPALAAGCSIVLKPAEQSPLTAIRMAQLATEAGLPDGVFNVVPGFGPTAGKALGLHRDVDVLAFTGSGEVGKMFLQYAGQSNMKRVWLECGGKSPIIIFDDVEDIDAAARATAVAMWFNQGEVCSAPSRLLVHDKIREAFLDRLLVATEAYHPGDPLDPATTQGAIVDQAQHDRILSCIERGKAEGARVVTPDGPPLPDLGGCYMNPVIFDGVTNDMTIAREEIFGPVLSSISFANEAEAIRIANDTPYGLGAVLWSSNVSRVHRASRALRAGTVWVNNYDASDVTVPFGGFKQSGNGRDRSHHALEKYTDLKTTWIRL
jgi:4-guanidinobutyraldehyde dehydrogenase / NAD-dependent aldehyde dehydrogenase